MSNIAPIEPQLVDNLWTLAEAYRVAVGEVRGSPIKITTVGANSTGTASFFTDLKSGKSGCTIRKYDLLIQWFTDHWPEGHVMPQLQDPRHYPEKGKSDGDEKKGSQRQQARGKGESKKAGRKKGGSKSRR